MRKAVIVLICCIFMFTACSRAEDKKAPDFTLQDITGKTIKLSGYAGKVVIINFWAAWCPPCRAELPDFVKFYDSYCAKDVEIIGIAVNSPLADIKKLAGENKITYPVCQGDGKVEALYGGIRAVPTTVIIDRKGFIRYNKPGMLSEKDLARIVDGLI